MLEFKHLLGKIDGEGQINYHKTKVFFTIIDIDYQVSCISIEDSKIWTKYEGIIPMNNTIQIEPVRLAKKKWLRDWLVLVQ